MEVRTSNRAWGSSFGKEQIRRLASTHKSEKVSNAPLLED